MQWKLAFQTDGSKMKKWFVSEISVQKIIFAVSFTPKSVWNPSCPAKVQSESNGNQNINQKNNGQKKSVSKTPCASVLSVSFFWPSFCSRRLTGRITASQLEWRNNVLRPWWQVWGQIFCPHTNPHHWNSDKQGVSGDLWGCEGRKRKKVFFNIPWI